MADQTENRLQKAPEQENAPNGREQRGKEPAEEPTLEENFARLDELASRLEEKDIPLEEAFRLYQEGMELLKKCSGKIDMVEKKMLQVNQEGELSEF